MIRELRARHRRTFVALAVVLPIGLGLALASRASVPASIGGPSAEPEAHAPGGAPASDAVVSFGTLQFRLRTWRSAQDEERIVELTPLRDLELPDVLVYWSDADAADELPSRSVLLGTLAGTRPRVFRWKNDGAGHGGGRLFLYSLARQELAANLELQK